MSDNNATSTPTATPRLPRLWRHHYAGVFVGYLIGRSDIPNHMKFEGRRVYSWSGGRLECSQLAKQGCREGDRLGEWTEFDISIEGSVEIIPMEPAVVEKSRALPADGEKA